MTLALVTDSAACLPEALAASRGIGIVPLHVERTDTGSSTARPSVDELAAAYRDGLKRAEEVLAVHLSGSLSGTIDNARLAAARVNAEQAGSRHRTRIADEKGPVVVLDSRTVGGALGLAVLAACEAVDARRGAARVRESTSRSRLFFLVKDLTSLRRGGRIDNGIARMGSALGVRPVLEVAPSGIRVVEMVRGAVRARRHLVAQAVRAAGGTQLSGPRPPAAPVRVAVHYVDEPADGQRLENELAEAMAATGAVVESILRSPVDPATAVHLGPGAVGLVVAPALDQPR